MNKNILQKLYGWLGFAVFWTVAGLLVWAVIAPERFAGAVVEIIN